MAKETKFGTFGGVYTPSLLTILGVIMYLRLPWVVGHAGIFGVMGIILVAHVISIATGLSISSIATDKNVGAGGPYYIVSRSLGLPIGGALGLALFIGLCFSTSLYVIGFSESLLSTLDIEITSTAIRITGSLVLVLITAVTVISTAFAIKTQYVVLGLIAGSLAAVLLGNPGEATAMPMPTGSETKPNLAYLFGIFFPAVTGFTAGVNMSGDLKDPKKAIPSGTMAAIFSGLLVYVGLGLFLGLQVPADALKTDPNLLSHIAFKGMGGLGAGLVIAGIWGATFSSGLGSIMGAPRILQALSVDQITPALFAKGKGPSKEPRNALILAFLIAEAGILIAELNSIARIVSMVFLTMYAFLNISCAIEAKVSPDFRPIFRIPASVSVIGALTCIVIMIQLDLPAMIGATAIMVGLFVALQRKQLKLESGDAWDGVWSTMIRSGLFRITGGDTKQQRNWSPNILSFQSTKDSSESYEKFLQAIITGNGILTDFRLVENDRRRGLQLESKERVVGIFRRELAVKTSAFDEIQTVCRHYGFSGLEPNALLLPWNLHEDDPQAFVETIDTTADLDFNIVSYIDNTEEEKTGRIDIWWQVDAGNVAFSMALLRSLTRDSAWETAPLQFLLLSSDSANNDNLRSTMRRLLRDARVDAKVRVVNNTFGKRTFVEQVCNLSGDAALIVLGLPNQSGCLQGPQFEELQALCQRLNRVLLVRGSSQFSEVLPTGRSSAISEMPPSPEEGGGPASLPRLTISRVPDVASATTRFSESYQRLVARLSERSLKKVYGRHIQLMRALSSAAEQHLRIENVAKLNNPRKLRTAFNRQQSAFLHECEVQLEAFCETDLPDLHSILEGGIDAFLHDDRVVAPDASQLHITRKGKDFSFNKNDSIRVQRFKRKRRITSWLTRSAPQYDIPIAPLQKFYFQQAIESILKPAIKGFITESHQMIVQLGKLLNSSRIALPEEDTNLSLSDLFDAQREQICRHLADMDRSGKALMQRRNWNLIVDALAITQKYADDIASLDYSHLIKYDRIPLKNLELDELSSCAGTWKLHQTRLSERARLALSLLGVQHRLSAIVSRQQEALEIGLKNGAQAECDRVLSDLSRLLTVLPEGQKASEHFNLHVDLRAHFEPQTVIDSLIQECSGSADDLPETFKTLTDESVQALEEGRQDAIEDVEVPVRRLMQFLTETELIGGISEAVSDVPKEEQRALGIAQDVVRLVNFQLSELDALGELDGDEFHNQMHPVIVNGIERLKMEQALLQKRTPQVLSALQQSLDLVIDRTNAYELSGQSARLDQHIRVYRGRRAVSGLRGLVSRSVLNIRNATVSLMYRRSEGILLAKKRRGELYRKEQVTDRVATMIRAEVPKPEVMNDLPFYYRQLFFGQSGVNETFWVGRREQLAKAKEALTLFKAGATGCVLVVGDRLAGKSALLQKLSTDVYSRRKLYRIHPPPGGSINPRVFERALKKALSETTTIAANSNIESTIAALPAGSTLFFDDINLWWERSPQGLKILESLLGSIQAHGNRVQFVLAIETQAFRFINRFVPLADSALAILECDPLPAQSLKSIVTLRHGSTGLKYKIGRRSEADLSEVQLARLFTQHFEHSGGCVGATLRSWIGSINRVKGDVLEVSPPSRQDWEALDTLRDSWVALLLQLALHKQMSTDRLRRVSGLPFKELREELDTLLRMGLIVESQRRILEIEPSITLALNERFIKRGVFS